MNKKSILEALQNNGLDEIEEIEYKEGTLVVRFVYDFDEDEIEAAKAYANDESDAEEGEEPWAVDFFLPYLSDLAVDNVGEIIEEIMEEEDIDSQYVSYDLDVENFDYNEFIAVFFSKDMELEIETVLDELEF